MANITPYVDITSSDKSHDVPRLVRRSKIRGLLPPEGLHNLTQTGRLFLQVRKSYISPYLVNKT